MSLARKLHKFPIAYKVWSLHRKSGLFDFEWYLRRNPDVRAATKRPFLHFAMHGIFEGRAPNPSFQSEAYLAANPDIAHTGLTPVQHYVFQGFFQKRLLAPLPRPEEKRLALEKNNLLREIDSLRQENDLLLLQVQTATQETAANKEDNELLLSQIHSVQEELENYFLKNKSLSAKYDALVTERSALDSEHEALKKDLKTSQTLAADSEKKIAALASQHQKDIASSNEENELLLSQLHSVQQEMENIFLKHDSLSKVAADRQTALEAAKKDIETAKVLAADTEKKLAELVAQLETRTKERDQSHSERDNLVKERDALSARLTTLDSEKTALGEERETLQKDLSAAKNLGAETEKKRAELAAQLETRTKERDQSRSERDNLVKERDQLKKTAGDRAARIAELEAQIADQAERQKLIDEQMVRAETQLEMLKEFLQPAFQ